MQTSVEETMSNVFMQTDHIPPPSSLPEREIEQKSEHASMEKEDLHTQTEPDVEEGEEDPGETQPSSDPYHTLMQKSWDTSDVDKDSQQGEHTPEAEATPGEEDEEELELAVRQQRQWKRLCERREKNLTYSMEEVARHNTVHDCWLVAHGKVYDATPMLFEHPAGVRSILRHAGQDATVDFDFHSNGARKMWKQYEIGTLEGHESKCTIM